MYSESWGPEIYDRCHYGLLLNFRRHRSLDKDKGGYRQLLTRVPVVVLKGAGGSRPSGSGVCQPDGIPPSNQEPLQSLCFLRETWTLLRSFPTYSLFEPRSQFDGHIQGSLLSAKSTQRGDDRGFPFSQVRVCNLN